MKKLITLLAVGALSASSFADVHINFINGDGIGTMATPTSVTWNETVGPTALVDHDGNATSITLTTDRPVGNQFDGTGGDNYNGTPHYVSARANLASGAEVHITLAGLNAYFPDGYIVVSQVGGASENGGASISLTEGLKSAWNASTDETYYFKTRFNPAGWTGTPTQTTATAPSGSASSGASYAVADYAEFTNGGDGYAADTITVTLDSINTSWAGIGGVEVIAIPEPATVGLLGIAGTGLFALRRRMNTSL